MFVSTIIIFALSMILLVISNPVDKKILIVMPSQSFLRLEGGVMVRVGTYFDEFAIPALALIEAGFELIVSTPQGNKPVLDPSSNISSSFPSADS